MSKMKASVRRRRWHALVGVIGVLAAVGLILAVLPAGAAVGSDPSGSGVVPLAVYLGGESGDCARVGYTSASELLIPNPKNGVTYEGPGGAEFTLKVYESDKYLDFTAGAGVAVVGAVVKGGNKSVWFDYLGSQIGPVAADKRLHGPGQSSTKLYSVSHLTLCYESVETFTGSCDSAAGPDNYLFQIAGKCAAGQEYVVFAWTAGGQQYAKLEPVGDGAENVPAVEKITWSFSGSAQNPLTVYYDDDLSDGLQPAEMPICVSDPRDPQGDNPEFDLLSPVPDVMPSGATSCVIRSVEDAGGIFTAYVYTTIDGWRGSL
jgi:hypothetical protein